MVPEPSISGPMPLMCSAVDDEAAYMVVVVVMMMMMMMGWGGRDAEGDGW